RGRATLTLRVAVVASRHVKRSLVPVLAAGLGLMPLVVSAQGVTIDHKAVGCIVAEQYPKMSACFVPAAGLARSRVYFRAGGTPHCYFVDGRPDMPCVGAVLGIVAGGAAVAGTAVALSGNDTTTTTSAITLPPGVTLPPVTTTTTTTTTTVTPQPFSADFKIFPFPPQGKEPFEVTFDEC